MAARMCNNRSFNYRIVVNGIEEGFIRFDGALNFFRKAYQKGLNPTITQTSSYVNFDGKTVYSNLDSTELFTSMVN